MPQEQESSREGKTRVWGLMDIRRGTEADSSPVTWKSQSSDWAVVWNLGNMTSGDGGSGGRRVEEERRPHSVPDPTFQLPSMFLSVSIGSTADWTVLAPLP